MASIWSLRLEQALLWCKEWRKFELTELTATTLISGKSGSGKSSAQSLLLRLFDVRSRVNSTDAFY
jgi:ABC-type microcin C transport system duplicated ATPase subunit YejF